MRYNKLILIASAVLLLSACTRLKEKFNSETTQGGSSGGGGGNAAALLQGAYGTLNGPFEDQSRWWAASEHSSDEAVGPTRGGDWDDNGVWRVYHNHKWTPDHGFLTDTYRELAQAQFAATTVLDANPTAVQKAEAQFLRAFAMWAVLDGWNQVPFRSTSLGDLTKTLPEVKKGKECADFIISELNAAIPALPAGNGIGRASKNAARALLMKVYLNYGVYEDRSKYPTYPFTKMNEVISMADQILADFPAYPGGFSANFFDNFTPNNDVTGKELVYTLKCDNASGFGGNNQFHWYCGTHYNQNPSGWNGFTTLGDFYDAFDANDRRRGGGSTGPTDFGYYPGFTNVTGMRVGMLFGQQKNGAGANLQDRKGNPLSFTKAVALKETGNNLEITGIRVVKYVPDMVHNFPSDNDFVIFRLADILLMKAEAILRGGTATAGPGGYGGTAAAIVNNIRTHASRGLAALGTVDLNVVYKERGFELYWEGWRRNDMIRFGKFLDARQLKGVTTAERLLYAIPNQQLTINPNLTQNPGY